MILSEISQVFGVKSVLISMFIQYILGEIIKIESESEGEPRTNSNNDSLLEGRMPKKNV